MADLTPSEIVLYSLIRKFPTLNPQWRDDCIAKWFDSFRQLYEYALELDRCKAAEAPPGAAAGAAGESDGG